MALETEIRAFDARKADLEQHYMGKWVVFHGEEFVGAFDNLGNAASEAVRRYGRGPYLIRQLGAPPVSLPTSVLYRAVADVADL